MRSGLAGFRYPNIVIRNFCLSHLPSLSCLVSSLNLSPPFLLVSVFCLVLFPPEGSCVSFCGGREGPQQSVWLIGKRGPSFQPTRKLNLFLTELPYIKCPLREWGREGLQGESQGAVLLPLKGSLGAGQTRQWWLEGNFCAALYDILGEIYT